MFTLAWVILKGNHLGFSKCDLVIGIIKKLIRCLNQSYNLEKKRGSSLSLNQLLEREFSTPIEKDVHYLRLMRFFFSENVDAGQCS